MCWCGSAKSTLLGGFKVGKCTLWFGRQAIAKTAKWLHANATR